MGHVVKGEVELPENGIATECGIIPGGFPCPFCDAQTGFALTEHKFLHTRWGVGRALQLDF